MTVFQSRGIDFDEKFVSFDGLRCFNIIYNTMKLDHPTKEAIIKRLSEKNAVKSCERCGNDNFSLLDGFVNLPLTMVASSDLLLNGPSVPCAVLGCTNCGNLVFHALGGLGLTGVNIKATDQDEKH